MSRNLNGWKKDPCDPRDLTFRVSGASSVPDSYSLREHVVDILDQGSAGSCVAQSVAQAIRIATLRDGAGWALPSRLWLYAKARQKGGYSLSDDSGCHIRDAFGAAKILGYPSEESWAYSDSRVFEAPAWKHHRLAHDQRWNDGYYRVAPSAAAIKQAVSSGCPVVFGTPVDKAFVEYTGAIWTYTGPTIGGHAMCIVGYDEDGADVVNSWGSEWGQNGYVSISWGSLEHYAADLWAISKPEVISEILFVWSSVGSVQHDRRSINAELHRCVPELGKIRLRGSTANARRHAVR